ncbi:hypothetical protein G7046_g402 [Stylonectria norvegica]|nr:hypothetical protein G7046_g402 [Stylonectria norvegica]
MTLSSRGYVSIAELIVYIPAIILSAILCSRHGFTRASGWVYTLILCLVRIVGAVCQLMTYSNHSSGLEKTTLIVDSIGISPLLLATLGMLSRYVDWMISRGVTTFTVKHFRLLQLLVSLGLILAIAGGTSGSTAPDGTVKVATTSKAGIILSIVAFVLMVIIYTISAGHKSVVPKQERRILLAIAVALPFIVVRLGYSALAIFLHNHTFSIVSGSVPVFVAMSVIEEFCVVADYLFLGYNLRKLEPEEKGGLANRQWKQGRNRNRGEPSGGRDGPGRSDMESRGDIPLRGDRGDRTMRQDRR